MGGHRAARVLGMPAVIVLPSDAPEIKAAGVRADGAEIRSYDRNTESREAIAAEIAADRGAVVVPSFDDADIIAGQGTCGLELAQQADALGVTAGDRRGEQVVEALQKLGPVLLVTDNFEQVGEHARERRQVRSLNSPKTEGEDRVDGKELEPTDQHAR